MIKLLKLGWLGAFAFSLLIYPAAWLLASGSREVWMINPFDPKTVELNEALWEMDPVDPNAPDYAEKVIGIYGQPTSEPEEVLFVSEERLLHPSEMKTLTLLRVDKTKGENPLQVKTVFFFAKWFCGGSFVVGVLIFVPWFLLSRKRRAAPSEAPPAS